MRRGMIPRRLARFSLVLAVATLASVSLTPSALGGVAVLALTPEQATNDVGTQHTVTANLTQGNIPMQGVTVRFSVSGANSASGHMATDGQGNATFAYAGTNGGVDNILAYADNNPPNNMQDPSEAFDTATKTWHTKKDPRTDDWPKLTADEMKSVQDLIDAGKNGEALAKLVEIMKKYCCNFDTMAGGAPEYDPKMAGEGSCERKKGGKVKIGKAAFRSAAWLYSSLKHEMVHSAQWQDEAAAEKMGSNGREKEAYQREIDQAGNTGVSDKDKKELERRLAAY